MASHLHSSMLKTLKKAFILAQQKEKEVDKDIFDNSRRRFIGNMAKTGAAVGFAGLLNACSKVTPSAPVSSVTQSDIVIIGAGMAGLNCLHWLQKSGINATVYEASTRVGGRIFTQHNVMAPGLSTEYGGEFIDSDHDDMRNLAQEFNLPLIDTKTPSELQLHQNSFYVNGRFYSLDETIAAIQPYAARIQSDIDSLPDNITFRSHNAAAVYFDNLSISEYFDSIGMTGWLRTGLEVSYLTEYGRELKDQSSINFLFLFSPDTSGETFKTFGVSDERFKIQGGNQLLIDAIYAKYQNNVNLGQTLVEIRQNNSNNSYILYFKNSNNTTQVVTASFVVIAIPFTVLRNIVLSVELPAWKTNAINTLGYGTNAKLMLGFNSRVWRNYNYDGYIFTDGIVQNGWDGSQLQSGNYGGYTAFQGGDLGVALGTGTPEQQSTAFIAQLEKIWPGCQAAFNGNVQRMYWPGNPYSLGSYACYKPGQWTNVAGAERASIDNLLFAGEHCSLAFQGYMNGAAETGRNAANNIIQAIRTGKRVGASG